MERKCVGSVAGSIHLEKCLTMHTAQEKPGENLQPYTETLAFSTTERHHFLSRARKILVFMALKIYTVIIPVSKMPFMFTDCSPFN